MELNYCTLNYTVDSVAGLGWEVTGHIYIAMVQLVSLQVTLILK